MNNIPVDGEEVADGLTIVEAISEQNSVSIKNTK